MSDYFKPFFLTYTSNATFQLYFIAIWLRSIYQKRQKRIAKNVEANNVPLPAPEQTELESPTAELKRINSADTVDSSLMVPQEKCLPPMTRKEVCVSLYNHGLFISLSLPLLLTLACPSLSFIVYFVLY